MKHPLVRLTAALFTALSLAACGGTVTAPLDAEERAGTVDTVTLEGTPQSNSQGDDEGTILEGTATAGPVTCAGTTGGTVDISGTIHTTGSVDSVQVTAGINGGAASQVLVLGPQDFNHEGRHKYATYSVNLSLPNGTNTVEICFVQSGSQGREPKQVCAAPVTVVVDCAPEENECSGVGFFGDIVGSGNLCNGNGPPNIPVHAKGDLGEAPALTISGPNGFSHSATMRHAGESCVYQYNWDAESNGGAGTYTFTVTGNGHTLSFTAELACQGR